MGIHQFKVQLNQRGCYANIELIAKFEDASSPSIEIAFKTKTEWEAACHAGILIFFDYYKKQKIGAMKIDIISIDWMPVDTNHLIVMYSTVVALAQEFGLEVQKLRLDQSEEGFFFPEPRTSLMTKLSHQ